jgi:hypothetical protein
MAALGFGTAVLPDSLHMNKPENYPAAKLVALDPASKEHKSVDAMFDELEVVKPTLEPKKGLVIEGVPERVPLKPRRWWKVGPHPFLVKYLPDVKFYVVLGSQGRAIHHWSMESDWLMALSHGRLYYLPKDLNQLLYDNGMSFTGADVQTWTRVACLVWVSLNREELLDRRREATGTKPAEKRDYWDLPAIPPMTFQDIRADLGGEADTVAVLLSIDGRPLKLKVFVWRMDIGTGASRHVGVGPWDIGPIGGPITDLGGPEFESRPDDATKPNQSNH